MEFDCFQPYFFDRFDAEEDFYKSTAPSEDIWKKFELLPTPPMSPHRTLSGAALYLSPGDQLSWLTKMLGQDEDYEGHLDTEELLDNLSAHIIQDCMWSSSGSKVGGRACGTPAPVRPCKTQCASPGGVPSAPSDCVDPAAVLTFPVSSCRKPASSGSESRSDSSGKDADMGVPLPAWINVPTNNGLFREQGYPVQSLKEGRIFFTLPVTKRLVLPLNKPCFKNRAPITSTTPPPAFLYL